MEVFKIIILSFSSLAVLFIITKILGDRQISQISLFDYIVGITIGSIAAEMATNLEEFWQPLIAMATYAIVTLSISLISIKSTKIRRSISGKSTVIFENGVFYKKNLKKAHMDIEDFLIQCRTQGYFKLSDIEVALLEYNGKVSVLPKAEYRPVNANDLNIKVESDTINLMIISDGIIIEKNLEYLNKDKVWLQKQLVSNGYNSEKDVFVGMCDYSGNINLYGYRDDENANLFK